ncbi:hypothetical protein PoB_004474000 [Plakobranchus ocellatus]|uniref:Uncharacterized protein n=1 Tax=Plakobranchus ocellatus TaxID=259542 RepID=A0AAV4BC87_9GAST|nr:hypothetical protein PoB_004474000 [Plakobranchus ocellatus]
MSSYEYIFTNHDQPHYPFNQKYSHHGYQHHHPPRQQHHYLQQQPHYHYHHHHYNNTYQQQHQKPHGVGSGAAVSSGSGVSGLVGSAYTGSVGGLAPPHKGPVCSHGPTHTSTTGSTHDAVLWTTASGKTSLSDETVSVTSSNVSPSSASSMFFSVVGRDLEITDDSEAEQTVRHQYSLTTH